MRSLKDNVRAFKLEWSALISWLREGMRLVLCVAVSNVLGKVWEVKWTKGARLDDSKGGAGPRRLELVHQ